MQLPVWAGLALLLSFLEVPVTHGAIKTITETEAVRIFLENSPQARLVALNAEAVGADLSMDTVVSNPAVAYQIEDQARKCLEVIAHALEGSDRLIMPTVPDREGEVISWHVLQALAEKREDRMSVV